MKSISALIALAAFLPAGFASADTAAKPIKALLITGGGYHDYEKQKTILTEGTAKRANIEWTVKFEKDTGKDKLPLQYQDPDWAKGFDVIVHNECYAAFNDPEAIAKVVAAHTDHEVGVVLIHCAMHTFRDARSKTKKWYELVGLESDHHGAHFPFRVNVVKKDHPIMAGSVLVTKNPNGWMTPKGELYATKATTCTPLATGSKDDPGASGEAKDQVCIWVNEIGKAKVFGTTIGHYNEEMEAEEFLDFMTRGILWTCGKIDATGKIAPGYGPVEKKTAAAN